MPRTKAQNEQKREEKREKILQAAIQLFSQYGFSETTVATIAKEAGVSFGSVFSYFPSKEELFRSALLEPLEREIGPLLLYTGEEGGSPLERIKQMVEKQVLTIARQNSYLRLIQLVLAQPGRFPDLFKELDAFLPKFISNLKPLVVKGQEAGELAKLDPQNVILSYLSFLFGIRLTILDTPDNSVWQLYARQGVWLFGPCSAEFIRWAEKGRRP